MAPGAGRAGELCRRLEPLSRQANRAAEALMAALLGLMAVLVGVQVAGRFLLGYSIAWSDELTRFLLVWISFLGVSVAARRGAHPGIETLVRALPPPLARLAGRLALLLSLAFLGLVCVSGGELVTHTWAQRSPSLGLRMSWPYLAVPLSALLVLLHWSARGHAAASEPGAEGANG
jgi:TRAP-type C4-dicarboxylate transport system permease small subunit